MRSIDNNTAERRDEQSHSPAEKVIFIHKIRESVSKLNSNNKWIIPGIGFGGAIVLLVVLLCLVMGQSTHENQNGYIENKHASLILNELSDMNSKLQLLSQNPQLTDNVKSSLFGINHDMSVIQQALANNAKAEDVAKISSQVSSMQNDMDTQILALKREVATGAQTKQFLDADVLPFHVISVDVISGQPFVSIDYDHHITPLALGDTVAGWVISSADYDNASVVFKNQKDQFVQVNLQGSTA